jgi:hypothetical protein
MSFEYTGSNVDREKVDVKHPAVDEANHPARRSAFVGSPDKHRRTPSSLEAGFFIQRCREGPRKQVAYSQRSGRRLSSCFMN